MFSIKQNHKWVNTFLVSSNWQAAVQWPLRQKNRYTAIYRIHWIKNVQLPTKQSDTISQFGEGI